MPHILGPEHSHGHFSRELEPVLEIDAGDSVVFTTLDAGWGLEPHHAGAYRPRREVPHAGEGHALVGPIAIRGARPGDTLAVEIEEIVPGAHGAALAGGWSDAWNERLGVVGDGVVHAYDLDAAAMTGRNQHGHEVALRPFMGILGMPPDAPGRHSTIPPRVTGGNLDCKELVAGSTLWLPIAVEGGLFSAGDGHAAQGDGEVGGTGIECPMERVRLRFTFGDRPLNAPLARTPAGWITFGLDADLDEAALMALEGMLDLLGHTHGLARRDALAYASVHVDLHVTQLVNEVRGVHAILRA